MQNCVSQFAQNVFQAVEDLLVVRKADHGKVNAETMRNSSTHLNKGKRLAKNRVKASKPLQPPWDILKPRGTICLEKCSSPGRPSSTGPP